MTIGEQIEKALVCTGKTQAELARFLKTKQSTISGWINDGKVPSADRILPLCDFFQVSPTWLLAGEDEHSDDASVSLLVGMYRALSPAQRDIVVGQVKVAFDVEKKGH